AIPGPAHELGILASGDVADIILEWSIRRWDGAVIFLDAAFHLRKKHPLEAARIGELGLRVCVLGIEMRTDLWVEQGRFAHDVLPVVCAQPGISIGEFDSVVHRYM